MRSFKFIIFFILVFYSCKKEASVKKNSDESVDFTVEIVYRISRNETLEKILLWKIPYLRPSDAYYFLKFFSKKVNPKYLKPGDKLEFTFLNGKELLRVNYIKRDTPFVIYRFDKSDGIYKFKKLKKEIKLDTVLYEFVIKDNLFGAFEKMEKGNFLADYVSDIFAWVIDFNTEVRKGDKALVLCERKFIDGEFFDYGKILYILYDGKYTGKREAFYFKGRYYDSTGSSLDKYFLRSPLPYGRISSKFTKKRFHPILRIIRPHHGIDYAAPSGTPIYAVGEGRVIFAGWKKGYGYFVSIRHKNGYVTGYGHMRRIRRGIRKGKWVRQGETIGYVGSTGLSTGPHLHFEIKKNGRFLNFLKIRPPSKKYLSKEEKQEFFKIKEALRHKIYEKLEKFAYNN